MARSTSVDDDSAGGIVRRQRDSDLVAKDDADAVLAQLAPEVSQDLMAILKLDAKVSSRQDLDDSPLKLYMLFSTHFAGQTLRGRTRWVNRRT
jgi:hypothetical protein